MTKRRKIGIAAIVLFLAGVVGGLVPGVVQEIRELKELEAMMDALSWNGDAKYRIYMSIGEEGAKDEETVFERLMPTAYPITSDPTITFWEYYCVHKDQLNTPPLIYIEAFDPATAERYRTVQMDKYSGTIYEKDGRAYLLWEPNERYILLLDYDPAAVEEGEIIKIAESCNI